MKNLVYLVVVLNLLTSSIAYSQQLVVDSLRRSLENKRKTKNAENDSSYILIICQLSKAFGSVNPDSGIKYAEKAAMLSKISGHKKGEATATRILGSNHFHIDNYIKALEYYNQALKLSEQIRDIEGIAACNNNMGLVYNHQGDYPLALSYYKKALQIQQELGNHVNVNIILGNIGDIYVIQKEYTKALNHYQEALHIAEQYNAQKDVAEGFASIGKLYEAQNDYKRAIIYYQKSLEINQKIGEKIGECSSLNSVGDILLTHKEYDKALEYYNKATTVALSIGEAGNKRHLASSYNGIAKTYLQCNNYQKSLFYAQKSLENSQKIGNNALSKESAEILMNTHKALKQYEQAFNYHVLWSNYKDSLQNENNIRNISRIEVQYEFEKKQKELSIIQKQKDLETDQKLTQQKFITYLLVFAFISASIFIFIIAKNRKKELESIKILEQQKNEIQLKSEKINDINTALYKAYIKIQQKNKSITEGLDYALRIQAAVLPFRDRISKVLGAENFFILFKPKDIVSGDFYWFDKVDDKIVIVLADSTGHGVPGAFMSMIGTQLLHEIIIKNKNTEPDKILYHLNKEVVRVLHQQETDAADGMDMAIVVLQMHQKKFIKMEYAGAMIPLYYFQNDVMHEIKPTKKSIAGIIAKADSERFFEKHEIIINTPTQIYLMSDGFQDQFGGTNHKKYMAKNVKLLLSNIYNKDMASQEHIISNNLENWIVSGNETQTDDITVWGINIL
jgi:tetratricopeptide (TPR) repeat protein